MIPKTTLGIPLNFTWSTSATRRPAERLPRAADARLPGLRGDGLRRAAGDLGRPADLLADPILLADRQLVLAQPGARRVDPGCALQCPAVVRNPDAAGGGDAFGDRHRDQLRAAAAERRDQPGRLAALGVDIDAVDGADLGAADVVDPVADHRL